jgi:hypothetical protein
MTATDCHKRYSLAIAKPGRGLGATRRLQERRQVRERRLRKGGRQGGLAGVVMGVGIDGNGRGYEIRRLVMDAIELTEAEATTLRDVVQTCLSELHTEISHTDDREFKAALRRRQELLQAVREKLSAESRA